MAARPKFKKTRLSNGLTLLTERHPEFRGLSIGIWVKTGTRHENPKEAGLSHFLEHMVFKGTEKRTALEIAREVDQVGGDFNAFTSRENTCFHIMLLDRDVNLGLEILCDILLNSTFDATELDKEKKVILQEIAMVEESPEEVIHDAFFELVYGIHGLGKPILGTEHRIRECSRADLIRFFRKHYRPERVVVAVAGNVSHEAVYRKLQSLTRGNWPGREPKAKPVREVQAPRLRSGCWWLKRDSEQTHLVWGVEGPCYSARDRFAAYLLNIYMGGGMSSALFQEIREKHALAYTVYSSLSPFTDSGVFSIYVATGINQLLLCLKLIEESVQKLQRELLVETDVQMLKNNIKASILLSNDSVESRMSSIAKNELIFGRYMRTEDACKEVDKVSALDIRRVARKLFRNSARSIVCLGPNPPKAIRQKLRPQFPAKYQK